MPSTVIRSFDYDPDSQQLWIRFVSGKLYIYEGVPEDIHDGLCGARSKGEYFNLAVRDRYPYREVVPA
jgi:lysyl-tRNA synthetase class 2